MESYKFDLFNDSDHSFKDNILLQPDAKAASFPVYEFHDLTDNLGVIEFPIVAIEEQRHSPLVDERGDSSEDEIFLQPDVDAAALPVFEQDEFHLTSYVEVIESIVVIEEQLHSPLVDEREDILCSNLDLSASRTGKRKRKFSKNLLSERKRRQNLNEKLYSLRAIVPKITKLDKASIMADAIDYVVKLKSQVEEMRNEISRIQSNGNPSSEIEESYDSQTQKNQSKNKKTGLQIEVEKLDESETCVFRFRCSELALVKVAKALEKLDIELLSASVNTFEGQIYSCYMTKIRNQQLMKKDNLECAVWNAINL